LKEFSFKDAVKIQSESDEICLSYVASQFEKCGFEKNMFKF